MATVSMQILGLWLFLLDRAPFAFCFAFLLDGETHVWLGDLCLCLFCVVDLPYCMTTGVEDFISTCFFTCKDRALELGHTREKKRDTVGLTLSCLEAIPIHFCGFSLMAPAPFCVVFAVFSAGETQIWPGDLRVVAVAVFVLVVLLFP